MTVKASKPLAGCVESSSRLANLAAIRPAAAVEEQKTKQNRKTTASVRPGEIFYSSPQPTEKQEGLPQMPR